MITLVITILTSRLRDDDDDHYVVSTICVYD